MAELATIARPYAEALFKLVSKQPDEASLAVQDWLSAFAEVAANQDVIRISNSPKVTHQELLDLFLGSLPKQELTSGIARQFLEIVIANHRLVALPEIAVQFRALVNAKSGVSDAIIYSPFEISDEELKELQVVLEKRFSRKLNLSVRQDSSLIGGIRVVVGDEELDTSVKARLEQMKVALTA